MALTKVTSSVLDTLTGLTVTAADGVADNDFVATISNQEATDGRSFGLGINAGSNGSDFALNINTHDAGANLMRLKGSGDCHFPNASLFGIGTDTAVEPLHVAGDRILVAGGSGNGAGLSVRANGNAQASEIVLAQGFVNATDSIGFLYNRANADFVFGTNNTQRMTLTSDGKLGIGESSPDSILHVKNSATDGVSGISLENDARRYAINVHGGLSDGLAIFNAGAGETQFFIASDGKIGIGADNTSPDSVLSVKEVSADPIVTVHKNSTGVSDAMRVRHGRALSGFAGTGISFRRNDGTQVGKVSIGFTNVTYDTTSDYRLKENVNYSWDATTKIKQLKPARFNFKEETGITLDGFLAHEVQEVVPQAVTGEKDAVDSEGNPEYQGIDHSKLVPLLVKTIQELEERLTALES